MLEPNTAAQEPEPLPGSSPAATGPSDSSERRLPAAQDAALDALVAASRALASGTGRDDALELALDAIQHALGGARIVVGLVDRKLQVVRIEAARGIQREALRVRLGEGVLGRVAQSGRAIVVPRVSREPMALAELPDPTSYLADEHMLVAAPIVVEGRVVGVLAAIAAKRAGIQHGALLKTLEVVESLLRPALRAALPELAAADAGSTGRTLVPPPDYSNMIGGSPPMRQVFEQISQVARTNATVLIRGESGTGKELVAHCIHHASPRVKQAFIKINCAALPEPLVESELFGHEKGAFTGAIARKKGRFELADGGTLFLDEVGELSPATQAKLLRVLQTREFERVGGSVTLTSDVRLVAATNKPMERAVRSGSFREDLYYRLNVFTILLPPLRDRRADIQRLAEHFLARFSAQHATPVRRISSEAMDRLAAHPWPGNVRELENVIERAVLVAGGPVLEPAHLPAAMREEPALGEDKLTLQSAIERFERGLLEDALASAGGNRARAARLLGTTERILSYRVKRYGIDCERFRR
jgi:Nif-specific regulatory protein